MKMVRPPLHAPAVSGVLDRLMRRRLTIVLTVAACLSLALLAAFFLPQRYTSTATVTVAPLTDTPYGNAQPAQLINMESERVTVTSLAVCEVASRNVDPRPTAREVQDALEVVIPPQSLVLRITATTPDAARSAQWADAVANAYLTDRTDTAQDATVRIASRLQSDIDAKLRTRSALTPPAKELVDREVAALRERQTQLSVVGLVPGRLVTIALPAQAPSTMSTRALLVSALAVGLLLGTLLALLQDRLDRRIGSAAWIEDTLGVPVRSAGGAALDRQARLVLGLLLGGGQEPARLLTVATPHVSAPTFAQRLTALAREQGVLVRYDAPAGLRQADAPIGEADQTVGHGDSDAPPQIHVSEWTAESSLPWPMPPTVRAAILAVEVTPDDGRHDLADFVDSVRYLGSEVDFAVMRDEATPARTRGFRPRWGQAPA